MLRFSPPYQGSTSTGPLALSLRGVGQRGREGWPATFLILALVVLLGCEQQSVSPPPQVDPRLDVTQWPKVTPPETWSEAQTQRILEACSRCHLFPPPNTLPRSSWTTVIRNMVTFPGGELLTLEELGLCLSYYLQQAPEQLQPLPAVTAAGSAVRFQKESFTPYGLENELIPAVSHVTFIARPDQRGLDILASEMRTQTLLAQSPWNTAQRGVFPIANALNYPAQVRVEDLDADGASDFLVSSLGGMNPSNDTRGGLYWLTRGRQISGGGNGGASTAVGFRRVPLLTDVGRVADARAVDLDGDGRQEIVAAVFGWRGPGQVVVLRSRDGSYSPESMQTTEVDDRDGAIHVLPGDYDGDGRNDFVVLLSQEHEQLVLYRSTLDGAFERQVLYQAPHPGWGSSGAVAIDFDFDGDQDFLLSNGDTLDDQILKPYHGIRLLENLGDLKFQVSATLPFYGCERAMAADIDGDGDLDIVAAAFLPQLGPQVWKQKDIDSVVWFEQVAGSWQRHVVEKHLCHHATLALGDYNNDGRVDIAVGNYVWLEQNSQPRSTADYITLFTQLP